MTADEILAALEERSITIYECEEKLNEMLPAFLYENSEIDKWNSALENALAQSEVLFDLLQDGREVVKRDIAGRI